MSISKWKSIESIWIRQPLAKHGDFKEAYYDQKEIIRTSFNNNSECSGLPPGLKITYEPIDILKVNLKRLQNEKNKVLERFDR